MQHAKKERKKVESLAKYNNSEIWQTHIVDTPTFR